VNCWWLCCCCDGPVMMTADMTRSGGRRGTLVSVVGIASHDGCDCGSTVVLLWQSGGGTVGSWSMLYSGWRL
jgi:hypothetical protein